MVVSVCVAVLLLSGYILQTSCLKVEEMVLDLTLSEAAEYHWEKAHLDMVM